MSSRITHYVNDLLTAANLKAKRVGSSVQILVDGRPIGAGTDVSSAVLDAFDAHPDVAAVHAQALHFAAALSFGERYLFSAMDELWGEDEEDDEEYDEEDEDDLGEDDDTWDEDDEDDDGQGGIQINIHRK